LDAVEIGYTSTRSHALYAVIVGLVTHIRHFKFIGSTKQKHYRPGRRLQFTTKSPSKSLERA